MRSRRAASSSESTVSMTSNSSTARRALFDCSGPTRCHSPAADPSAAAFACRSWTRFSARVRKPASIAARMRSGGTVFVTATISTPSGSRPARAAGGRDPLPTSDRCKLLLAHTSIVTTRPDGRTADRPK